MIEMTYDRKAGTWAASTRNLDPRSFDKIQPREGYYRAWCGNYTNTSDDLEELVRWVEKG